MCAAEDPISRLDDGHLETYGAIRFCLLAYRPISPADSASSTPSAVMLVRRNDGRGLTFMVDPEIRNFLSGEDLDYLDALVMDFLVRAEIDSDALFAQLCALSGIGPLVPVKLGSDISDFPAVFELCSIFVEV